MIEQGQTPELLGLINERDEAIKALVLEGAWAEDMNERRKLLGELRGTDE